MTLADRNICNGCAACFNICRQSAISMKTDSEGFAYPVIDDAKCTKCGLCEKVCPVLHKVVNSSGLPEPEIFAAWSLDEETRFNSTSGGIFSELAKLVMKDGGVVFGARYNENNEIEHCAADDISDLPKLRQSKYAQSDIGLTYAKIKKALQEEREVLFCGTPCQNAALASFLNNSYSNLITCDFICKGVNSPKVYRKYLDMLEKQYKSKVKVVHFKNKTYGWNKFSTKVLFENGDYYLKNRFEDLFMIGYVEKNLYLRPSCYNCHYKGLQRVSDITLGDFWGLKNKHPDLDEDKGTSVVFLNTPKGQKFFDRLGKAVFKEECAVDEVLSGNRCVETSAPANKNRQAFFNELDTLPFDALIHKYCKENNTAKIKKLLLKGVSKGKRILFGS